MCAVKDEVGMSEIKRNERANERVLENESSYLFAVLLHTGSSQLRRTSPGGVANRRLTDFTFLHYLVFQLHSRGSLLCFEHFHYPLLLLPPFVANVDT
ncbi:hypothetical protein L596_003742 [Steinernema carpocapsae]|uniref:Uncharacterized protein n=1 Tax=Steinernema carpocapsae TaxID=34508 RepID=A0A4U8UTJ9_STECR|nr:hypothetical protein L596_003742 [Steinernema carpocapsae]